MVNVYRGVVVLLGLALLVMGLERNQLREQLERAVNLAESEREGVKAAIVEIEDSRQTIRQASEVILEQRLQIAFLSMALALFEREQPDSQSTYETGPLEEAPLQL